MRLALVVLVAAASAVGAQDSTKKVRRIPVTPEHERTAFLDPGARELVLKARQARLAQDSALNAYDAKSFFRMSVGMGFRKIGPQRLFFRTEQSANLKWVRGSGAWVEPTGQRSAFPMGHARLDMVEATPIPYYPGRESLWLPGDQRLTQVEVNEDDLLHPLATGAEAYYRYATGDSISFRLPDRRVIGLRELRITARRPQWRAIVGSFWFDVESGGLVRAAYRMATEIDLWQEASEEQKRDLALWEERALRDTGKAGELARKRLDDVKDDKTGIRIASTLLSPARAKLTAVTVEYGLYEGGFWLPKANVAEGEFIAGFIRVPLKWEESFRYNSVNSAETVVEMPKPGTHGLALEDTVYSGTTGEVNLSTGGGRRRTEAPDTAAIRQREDSTIAMWRRLAATASARADSFATAADTAKEKEQRRLHRYYSTRARAIERRREGCKTDSTYVAGVAKRFEGAVLMAVRLPCNPAKLANSEDLPGSIYDAGEELFGTTERDALVDALGFGLQAGWGPQKPDFHTGLDLTRFNRIEALSLGGTLTSQLGLGYTARLLGRFGFGDMMPNGEISLARSNGRSEVRLGAFHRLGVANDDWGQPLSFGASVSNLIDAGDEGFYYRTWGAELAGSRDAPGPLGGVVMTWRLFAERQRSAGTDPNTQISLGNLFGDTRYVPNIDATPLWSFGGAADFARSFGANPRGFRFDSRMRLEAAGLADAPTSIDEPFYARGVLDWTLSRPLTRGLAASLTTVGGASAGTLPIQRGFFIGGLHTVRGQSALPLGDGRVGDAFWLGRAELGLNSLAFRPTAFYDAGWAGDRTTITDAKYRPLSGWGLGVSLIDGLVRFDASRGLWPEKQWRFDLYLGSRF